MYYNVRSEFLQLAKNCHLQLSYLPHHLDMERLLSRRGAGRSVFSGEGVQGEQKVCSFPQRS